MASVTRRCAGGVAASPRSGAAAGGGRRGTGAARAVAASACSFANRLANPSLRALGRRDRRPVAAFRTHGGAGESRPETGGEDAPSRVDFSPGPSSRSSQLWSVTQPPSARFAPALFSGVGRPCGWWCACFVGERVESSRILRKEKSEKSEVNVSLVCLVFESESEKLIDREPRSKGAADRFSVGRTFERFGARKTGTCHPGTQNRAKGVGLFRSDSPGRKPRRPPGEAGEGKFARTTGTYRV